MNSAQIHLALTHVPVILSLTGLVILLISYIKKNPTLVKTSYFILIVAGLWAIPVFLTGEGTEELVEKLPGISKNIIEEHEEAAKLAIISISASGLMALTGLFVFQKKITARSIKSVVLLLALSSGGLLVQTAHLGGQIRHTEIRSTSVVSDQSMKVERSNAGNHTDD